MPDRQTVDESNVSGHHGINQRLNARLLSQHEFRDLQNVDVSVPGVRTKRLGPKCRAAFLDKPLGLHVVSILTDQICIEWITQDIPSYLIQRRLHGTLRWFPLSEVTPEQVPFCDTTIETGTNYDYRVIGQSEFGCQSDPSDLVTAWTNRTQLETPIVFCDDTPDSLTPSLCTSGGFQQPGPPPPPPTRPYRYRIYDSGDCTGTLIWDSGCVLSWCFDVPPDLLVCGHTYSWNVILCGDGGEFTDSEPTDCCVFIVNCP